MAETNGRIRLSWSQIAWAVATIATIIGSWYDTRGQLALIRQEVGLHVQHSEVEHARMWKAIDEANAAERPKPRR